MMDSIDDFNDAQRTQLVTRSTHNNTSNNDASCPLISPQSPQNIPRPFWAKLAQDAQRNGGIAPNWSPQLFRVVKSAREEGMASVSPENGTENGQKRNKMAANRPIGRYFSDGKRLIDYVLAYDLDNSDEESVSEDRIEFEPFSLPSSTPATQNHQTKSEKRRIFEHNLKLLGLELEYIFAKHSRIGFVLIHAPFKVLMKQAELLKLKMPVYQNDVKKHANLMDGAVNSLLKRCRFLDFDDKVKERIETRDYFCQPFIEQHLECFVNHEDPETFFSRAERSRMVYDLLIRTRYDLKEAGDKYRFGVERLVKNGTYNSCYPLHDELSFSKEEKYDPETCSDRQLLYENWVQARNVWKYQPLHLIKNYFGTKIGFYFAWLGYYTRFLYIISIIGVFCVVYGIATMGSDLPSQQICNSNSSNVLMCPICTNYCDYTPLNASCTYSKITYIFDNSATILFAAVMSIWATLFLEGWKRYHAELAYKWNVFDFEAEEEVLRPEFQYRKSQQRVNPVTQEKEPYIPIFERVLRFSFSGITVLFFLCLVIALVIGIIAYRIIVLKVFFQWDDNDAFKSRAFILTSVTAACINLVFILIMNYVYSSLALKLTEWECPRTQTEFDNSYTLKVFLFQFINFYSSLFYIAFIKGKFSGPPEPNNPAALARVNGVTMVAEGTFTIFGNRLEECDPAGCMVELVIQLFIIMCGKQFFSAFMEIGYPTIMNIMRRWRLKLPMESEKQKEEIMRQRSQTAIQKEPHGVTLVERDYCLNPVSEQFLFDEYLEMVIQFGFCTLFVCAFPLAPLFALLNNILEIRLDAFKFIVTQRKPIPSPARNIGIWMTILDLLSKLSVLCNAFVIAFTSDFVPRLFHYLTHEGSMDTYLEESLSIFNAAEIVVIGSGYANVTQCRYRDYRRPPCSLGLTDELQICDNLYSHTNKWWMLLAFRLIFVLVFEHVVLSIKAIFAYIIPDVPTKIMIQLQRERYLARQAVLQRTDTFSNGPSTGRSEPPSDAAPTTDPEAVAYQGEDAFEAELDDPDFESCKEPSEALKRMYSDRKKPSLSSAASSVVLSNRLPIHGSRNALPPATSHSANELSDTSNSLQVPIHAKSLGSEPPTSSSSDSFHTAPSIRLQPPEDVKFQKKPEMDSMA